ncbi:MAG: hypothetical protein B5766_01045 [Candidatus Lumbricidophila eiseniae]|uniref:Uncharacterized protein n=1 Tax=Candidatus Lumbricidiphila eiseniae TaxID=1969409 RepID=A0A2A6FUT6_9MICO|nr:MAG: hypothetical protein B5766_01045 [Candidatus Lumbricidophila eiseniae]
MSRQCVQRWIVRYWAEGEAGLEDYSSWCWGGWRSWYLGGSGSGCLLRSRVVVLCGSVFLSVVVLWVCRG